MKAKPKPEISPKPQPSFPPGFLVWWKEHIHSGFVQDKEGKYHWNITPKLAYNCARYRSEFTGQDEYASKEEMQR